MELATFPNDVKHIPPVAPVATETGELVFPEFNDAFHVLDARPLFPEGTSTSQRYVSLRVGFTTPFVAVWYHYDTINDALYAIQEFRAYRQTTNFVVNSVLELTRELWSDDATVPVNFIANDATLLRGVEVFPIFCPKIDLGVAISQVRQRLIDNKLFFYREQLVETVGFQRSDDVEPAVASMLDEWQAYTYCVPKDFSITEKRPVRCNDGGLQTLFQVIGRIKPRDEKRA